MMTVTFIELSTLLPQAASYADIVTAALRGKTATSPTSPGGFLRDRVRLTLRGDYGLSLQAFNPVDDNSVVNVIYQVRLGGWGSHASLWGWGN